MNTTSQTDISNYVQYPNSTYRKGYRDFLDFSKQTIIDEAEIYSNWDDLKKLGFRVDKYFVMEKGNRCSKTGWRHICSCGAVNFRPKYCHDKHWCPICNRAYAVSLGCSVFHTLIGSRADYVAHLVLTVPEEHPFFKAELISKYEKEEGLRALAKKFMSANFRDYGYVCVVHSWATKTPIGYPHWHIHVLIPLIKFDENRKRIIRGNGYKAPLVLKELRISWRGILGWHKKVNLNYRFSRTNDEEGLRKIRHWSNYISRGAVVDINKYLLEHKDFQITTKREAWIRYHVDPIKKNYRRVRWYGIFSEFQRSRTLEKLGTFITVIQQRVIIEKLAAKKIFCWNCNDELPRNREAWDWHGFIEKKYFVKRLDIWDHYRDLISSF